MFNEKLFYEVCKKYKVEIREGKGKPKIYEDGIARYLTLNDVYGITNQDSYFERALKKFENLSDEEFLNIMESIIKDYSDKGEENDKLKSFNDYCRKVGHIDRFPINVEKSSNEKELKVNNPFQKYQEYIKISKEIMEDK